MNAKTLGRLRVRLLIRRALHSDCEGISRVHVAAIRELCATSYSPAEIEAWSAPRGADSYARAIDTRMFLVAEHSGDVVAFGQLNQSTGEVDAVYVHPVFVRQGIGIALLRALEDLALDHSLERLFLHSSLNAVPFYVAAGFRSDGRASFQLRVGIEIACENMYKPLVPRAPPTRNGDAA